MRLFGKTDDNYQQTPLTGIFVPNSTHHDRILANTKTIIIFCVAGWLILSVIITIVAYYMRVFDFHKNEEKTESELEEEQELED